MPLGFPSNPVLNQTFNLNGNIYTWDGFVWTLTSKNLSLGNLQSGAVYIQNTGTINGADIITTATLNQYAQTNLSITAGTDISVITVNSQTKISNISTFDTVISRGAVTTGSVRIANTTNAISSTTGALIVSGGVGIGLDLVVGGTIYAAGKYVLTTSSLYETVASGPDILITATNATANGLGYLVISDVSTLQSVTARGNTTDQSISIQSTIGSTSTNTGALTVSGGVGVNGTVYAKSVQIGASIMSSNRMTINTTATTVIDAYSFRDFRSTKYLVQIESGANIEVIEILLMVDNAGTVYATEYGVLTNNGELGEFSAEETNNTVSVFFTPKYASTEVTYFRTTMAF